MEEEPQVEIVELIKCTKCKKDLPLPEFYNPRFKNKTLKQCSVCRETRKEYKRQHDGFYENQAEKKKRASDAEFLKMLADDDWA